LESSFAQFQADRSVVGLARQVQRNVETMATYEAEMDCHCGDFAEYFDIRVAIAEHERAQARHNAAARRAATAASLEKLRVGDVIRVPAGRRAGLAVVLDVGMGGFNDPRPLVLTEDRWAGRLSAGEFAGPVEALARVRVPKNFNHREPAQRRDLAAALRAAGVDSRVRRAARRAGGEDAELDRLRHRLRQHPCHGCPEREEHARWAERRHRLHRDTEALREKVSSRTGSLARTFDQVCALLADRGYLDRVDGELTVTESGRTLARVWTEADLLVAECLRRGVWEGLGPAELAAAVSVVLYEARRESEDRVSVPRGPVGDAVDSTVGLWQELEADEADRGLELTREPDLGFVWPMYRWARGEALSKVLASVHTLDGDMPAGDFVRWARQVIDLLGQLTEAAGASSGVRQAARDAIGLVNRGVLAYASLGTAVPSQP
jgi:ATP-dependent RNA helicase HelY